MIVLGQLLDELANAGTKLTHFRNSLVKTQVQLEYMRTSCEWPWLSTRASMSATMDGEGVLMPSNMAGNMLFAIDDSDIVYYPRDASMTKVPTGPYPTWYIEESSSAEVSGTGFSITNGTSTAEVGTDLTDYVGEYIRFGGVNDIFKISSAVDTEIVLDHVWKEASVNILAKQIWEVRPAGTKTVTFLDESGDEVDTGTMAITYGELPNQVYDDSDPIRVPDEVLSWKVAARVSNGATERERSLRNYNEALMKAKASNPDPFMSYQYPRGKNGSFFDLTTHIYKTL